MNAAAWAQESLDAGHEVISIRGLQEAERRPGSGALQVGQFGQRERELARRAGQFGGELVAICSRSTLMRCDSHHTTG